MEPLVLGWREWVALPQLGLPALEGEDRYRRQNLGAACVFHRDLRPRRCAARPLRRSSGRLQFGCGSLVHSQGRRPPLCAQFERAGRAPLHHRDADPDRRPGMAHRGVAFEPAHHGAPDAAWPRRARSAVDQRPPLVRISAGQAELRRLCGQGADAAAAALAPDRALDHGARQFLEPAADRGGGGARPRDRADRHAALLYGHQVHRQRGALRGQGAAQLTISSFRASACRSPPMAPPSCGSSK